jgi:hypothetical protein
MADMDVFQNATSTPAVGSELSPASIKDGEKTVQRAFKDYKKRVAAARNVLVRAEKAHTGRVKEAQRARTNAASPKKIAAIGALRRVTLTETSIRTPKGEFSLTPDVEARAEQHGNKQVVQGWVFKSDNDRREIYLHLQGADWAEVVSFPLKHSVLEPRQLHEFAAKVGVAARASDRSRAALEERVRIATSDVVAATADRAEVHAAAEAYVTAAWDVGDLKPATDALAALLERADLGDRKNRKVFDGLSEVRAEVKQALALAEAARQRVQEASLAVTGETSEPSSTELMPERPTAKPDETPKPEPPSNDVLDQIRRLGELRDAGLVTPEEFEDKKRELLARL